MDICRYMHVLIDEIDTPLEDTICDLKLPLEQ